jgi:hypothetical protein
MNFSYLWKIEQGTIIIIDNRWHEALSDRITVFGGWKAKEA